LASQIHADGSLTNAQVPAYSTPDALAGLAAHPTADFLYVSGDPGVLKVFAIDSATGALSPTSSVTTPFIFDPVITPNGRYLYLASNPGQQGSTAWQIAGFSTNATTGALSPVPGSPISPATHAASSPIMMAIDPTGKFLYAAYVGSGGGLAAYSIDAASGALTAVPGSPFDVGDGPGSVAIDASGTFLLASMPTTLAVFSIDPGTGALTPGPASPFGTTEVWGGVAADPSGRYFYAGAVNKPATVFTLSIDQTTGATGSIGETTILGEYAVSFIALTH
jgi:6-phosphogluconolactonase (cycloisomerase 2 family)